MENFHPELLHSDDKIVGQRIPPVKCLAVLGNLGSKAVRPFIIGPGHVVYPFNGSKHVQTCAGCLCKFLPVCLVDHHDFRRFRRGKNPKGTVGGNPSLFNIGVHVPLQLLFIKILR